MKLETILYEKSDGVAKITIAELAAASVTAKHEEVQNEEDGF